MPSYNSAKYIEESISAIQSQDYENWELIITDDCSTDNTCEIIQNIQVSDDRIKLHTLKENSGPGVARNNSIKHARGRYIAFCDSDDTWFETKLSRQIEFMKEFNLTISYTGYKEINEEGKILKTRHGKEIVTYKDMLRNNYIHCFTAMYDTIKIGKMYMPAIRKRQDWLLWIEILKCCKYAKGLSLPLGYYRVRKNSLSSNKFDLIKHNYNVYRRGLKFSKLKSTYRLFIFFLFYAKKKLK